MYTVKVAGVDVELDPSKMEFNATNITQYFQEEAVNYAFYAAQLAEADYEYQKLDAQCEAIYSSKYTFFKDQGGTDKKAEFSVKSDPEYIAASAAAIDAKRNVKHLAQFLKTWDKAHDNAQSMGHMIRKEMDKLNLDSDIQKIMG